MSSGFLGKSCSSCVVNSDYVELNGFKLAILPSDPAKGGVEYVRKYEGVYVRIKHNTGYKIELTNTRGVRCDVELSIDGSSVGGFRVNGGDSMTIERPADQARKFLFLKSDSKAAENAGIQAGDPLNGVIRAVFRPEKPQPAVLMRSKSLKRSAPMTAGFDAETSRAAPLSKAARRVPEASFAGAAAYSSQSLALDSAGATALGDASNQTFVTVSNLTDIDTANITEIAVRLVATSELKPVAIGQRNKAPVHSTPIPPPLM
jgi:hypothetical protein